MVKRSVEQSHSFYTSFFVGFFFYFSVHQTAHADSPSPPEIIWKAAQITGLSQDVTASNF